MDKINSIGIIGAGALGVMYGRQLNMHCDTAFIVDDERRMRYAAGGHTANGQPCGFRYISGGAPFDLLIFAVKYTALGQAVELARPFVRDDTIILSVLNGIKSEDVIAEGLGGRLLYCVVHGMDATKSGSDVRYSRMGTVVFGEKDNRTSHDVRLVSELFERCGIDYLVPDDILHRMWSKLMLNTGVNQVAAVFGVGYGGVQAPGKPRETMIAAMKEAQAVAAREGISLADTEIDMWLGVIDSLDANGMPSMLQDVRAGRKTEVELFAGTVCALGKKHGVATPVNGWLFEKINELV